MKQYEVQRRLSGGGRLCEPVDAEDLEAVRKIALERVPDIQEQLPYTHPGEVVEAVEIYELVKVAALNVRPRVVPASRELPVCKVE